MNIHESGENYLETILLLQKKNGFVRSIDVATELSYSKASISRAMGILKRAGYLLIQKDGGIVLTDLGRQRADEIYQRHVLLRDFLQHTVGVSADTAEKDACRIEHILSQETLDCIEKLVSSQI